MAYSYTILEYLQSTGTQYIVTDIVPTYDMRLVADLKYGSLIKTINDTVAFGYVDYMNENGTCFAAVPYTDGTIVDFYVGYNWDKYDQYGGYYRRNCYNEKFYRRTLTLQRGSCSWGNYTINSLNVPVWTSSPRLGLPIFGRCIDDIASKYEPCKAYELYIYSFKIYNGDDLIHDLVPVERQPDGELGLYDTVTQKFYGNAGTGKFVKGKGIGQIKAVPQYDYIVVYDMENEQLNFHNNGLAVLCPTSCRVTENLNGAYSLIMEHPIDLENKWKYLMEFNHLEVLGQLFTIKKVDNAYNGGSGKATVYAEHIFYQLNDPWLFPKTYLPSQSGSGRLVLSAAMAKADYARIPSHSIYEFSYDSDVKISTDISENLWDPIESGMTVAEFILGSGGLIENAGGELYRDNFRFSVNERMKGALDNAFNIHVGLNLKGIKRTVDLSTVCTYFRAYDNFGSWWAISLISDAMPRKYPHNVVRSQNFSYDAPNMERLKNDGMNYFKANCAPLISYTVTLEDVKNNPDYADFSNNPRYKVGDKGHIYDERLGISLTLEITKTVKDGITGKTLEVTFGSTRSFTRPKSYDSAVVDGFEPVFDGGRVQLRDKNGVLLFDKNHVKLMERIDE